ncbi:MAG: hypothetical protein HY904_01000 [Deltaproteobacteria bacterium]|nr:hypothetical protein [Deltaproteobacteria bacterium]
MLTTTPPASAAPRPAAWPAVVFALAVAWAGAHRACTADGPVTDSRLDAVVEAVGQAAPQALVVVHPPWRTDVADALRARLGARDVTLALPADALDGRRPVVAVRWPRAPGPGALWRLRLDGERDADGVTVSFHAGALGGAPAPAAAAAAPSAGGGAWALPGALAAAVVQVRGGREVDCNAWDAAAQRWNCPGMDEWNYVGLRTLPIAGRGRACLWAHPVTGATLSIRFPKVALGKALLVGHGLSDGAAGAQGGQPVDLAVTAGAAARALRHPNVPGWAEDRVETPGGGMADVLLEVTTPHDGARHFCVWLEVEP